MRSVPIHQRSRSLVRESYLTKRLAIAFLRSRARPESVSTHWVAYFVTSCARSKPAFHYPELIRFRQTVQSEFYAAPSGVAVQAPGAVAGRPGRLDGTLQRQCTHSGTYCHRKTPLQTSMETAKPSLDKHLDRFAPAAGPVAEQPSWPVGQIGSWSGQMRS